jgi:hypothetical protein
VKSTVQFRENAVLDKSGTFSSPVDSSFLFQVLPILLSLEALGLNPLLKLVIRLLSGGVRKKQTCSMSAIHSCSCARRGSS